MSGPLRIARANASPPAPAEQDRRFHAALAASAAADARCLEHLGELPAIRAGLRTGESE